MRVEDEQQFKTCLAKAAILSQSDFIPGTTAAYWEEFKDWTIEQFEAAILKAARTTNMFPTVKRIRENKPVSNSTGWLKKMIEDENNFPRIADYSWRDEQKEVRTNETA